MSILIFNLLLRLLLLYLVWRVVRTISFYFREFYMLWNIATAGSPDRRKMNTKMRLYVYVCQTDLLDECSITELYKFLLTMIDADTTIQEFHKLALSYTYAVVFRERNDGSLRGVMLVGIDKKHNDIGSPFTVVRVGLGFLQLNYRGGPYMYSFIAYHFLKELIMRPLTPLYVLGKAFSYKSYCVMAHTLQYSYPRYDHETPAIMRDIINQYAHKEKLPKERYNEDTFILERERVKMKNFVAILDEQSLKDPHIKFFVERNPGWVKGHQMICIGRVTWTGVIWMVLKSLLKAMRGRKSRKVKPGFLRRDSFQVDGSNKYVNSGREMDALCHHHPGELEDFSDIEQW